MKYIDEFRQRDVAQALASEIKKTVRPDRFYRLMEFCGGHTHAIFRYGLPDLMPDNVEFIHGPGCPVCVLPSSCIDRAIERVQGYDAILCTYADMLRVPASGGSSLFKAKAAGADIRMVYSPFDALKISQDNPQRQVIFLAIGFETTTPPTAVVIKQAAAIKQPNFSVDCNHVLTPAALLAILTPADGQLNIDGFIGPSHVSTVIGSEPYEFFARTYKKPMVISGFEPLDVMQSILMLIHQINRETYCVENQYSRAVTPGGNRKAQALMAEVFTQTKSFEWRGLGHLPHSALQIRENFSAYDANLRFPVETAPASEVKSCRCPEIIRGIKKPHQCKLFGTVCTPENPLGACMVSSEGACAAYWSYGRFRDPRYKINTINEA